MSDSDYILNSIQKEADSLRNDVLELRKEISSWKHLLTAVYEEILGVKMSESDLYSLAKSADPHISGQGTSKGPIALTHLEHNYEQRLYGVHPPSACAGGTCPFHLRSNHSLRGFPQVWHGDRETVDRLCSHGYGHPDPDSPWHRDSEKWNHECDGCCWMAEQG